MFEVLTVIEAVVAPFDHKKLAPPVAVNCTEPPLQKVVGPFALMIAFAPGLNVTCWLAFEMPQLLVAVTT